MSSILEALEKSERERNQDSVPRYHSMQPPTEGGSIWKYILFALLGLSLLLSAYFLVKHFQLIDKISSLSTNSATLNNDTVSTELSDIKGAEGSVELQKSVKPNRLKSSSDDSELSYIELTDEEKSLLPTQRINVVSVSENKKRSFVMLGDNMYREGNTLGKGSILKEIHKDHILIEFNGRLIRRPLD